MEIFYNELSSHPLASSKQEAKERIVNLLKTLKSLRGNDINIMRTYDGFYAEKLSADYNFADFFGDPSVNTELKILLRTVIANPYIEDDDSYEAEIFITNTFTTQNENDEKISPEGLASAYIFSSPVISLESHLHWKTSFLELCIEHNDSPNDIKKVNILNVYSPNCKNSTDFQNWLIALNPPIQLNSEENIYQLYPSPKYSFEPQAISDIISWFYDDKRYLIRVKELIEDIENNPFVGGKGKTETLGGTDGKASKRIVKKDRIIYTYTKEKITIHQCRGHYNDK